MCRKERQMEKAEYNSLGLYFICHLVLMRELLLCIIPQLHFDMCYGTSLPLRIFCAPYIHTCGWYRKAQTNFSYFPLYPTCLSDSMCKGLGNSLRYFLLKSPLLMRSRLCLFEWKSPVILVFLKEIVSSMCLKKHNDFQMFLAWEMEILQPYV